MFEQELRELKVRISDLEAKLSANKLQKLGPDASTEDIKNKINEIIQFLNLKLRN